MKRTLSLKLIIICACVTVSAQNEGSPNQPDNILPSGKGFISINELTVGIGLGETGIPYSKSYFGITTIYGYQTDFNFISAVGTGLSFYNGGTLVPLFLDFRYGFNIDRFNPYIFIDGGLLFNFSDFKEGTKLFINPGIGVRYCVSMKIAVTLGGGLLAQFRPHRDAFANIKAGISYHF